jgi:hypothetical protein
MPPYIKGQYSTYPTARNLNVYVTNRLDKLSTVDNNLLLSFIRQFIP